MTQPQSGVTIMTQPQSGVTIMHSISQCNYHDTATVSVTIMTQPQSGVTIMTQPQSV